MKKNKKKRRKKSKKEELQEELEDFDRKWEDWRMYRSVYVSSEYDDSMGF